MEGMFVYIKYDTSLLHSTTISFPTCEDNERGTRGSRFSITSFLGPRSTLPLQLPNSSHHQTKTSKPLPILIAIVNFKFEVRPQFLPHSNHLPNLDLQSETHVSISIPLALFTSKLLAFQSDSLLPRHLQLSPSHLFYLYHPTFPAANLFPGPPRHLLISESIPYDGFSQHFF